MGYTITPLIISHVSHDVGEGLTERIQIQNQNGDQKLNLWLSLGISEVNWIFRGRFQRFLLVFLLVGFKTFWRVNAWISFVRSNFLSVIFPRFEQFRSFRCCECLTRWEFTSMCYLENFNKFLPQRWKNSQYMYAKCLNCLCFINYLPVLINASYKIFMQVQLGGCHSKKFPTYFSNTFYCLSTCLVIIS